MAVEGVLKTPKKGRFYNSNGAGFSFLAMVSAFASAGTSAGESAFAFESGRDISACRIHACKREHDGLPGACSMEDFAKPTLCSLYYEDVLYTCRDYMQ